MPDNVIAFSQRLPKTMPVFRLAAPDVGESWLTEQAEVWTGVRHDKSEERSFGLRGMADGRHVDAYKAGGLWIKDPERLWGRRAGVDLPGDDDAVGIARDLVGRSRLSGPRSPYLQLGEPRVDRDRRIRYEVGTTKRTSMDLNVHVGFSYRIFPRGADGPDALTTVGGGSNVAVKLGEKGRLVGMSGAFRSIADIDEESPVIPWEEARDLFLAEMAHIDLEDAEATVAYYLAPAHVAQQITLPVYLFRAFVRRGQQRHPLRIMVRAAVERGKKEPPPGYRADSDGTGYGRYSDGRDGSIDRRVGAWWIDGDGLSLSQDNAKNFVDARPADWGYTIDGNASALRTGWTTDNDTKVDRCDLAFYTGHASKDGWMLAQPALSGDADEFVLVNVTPGDTGGEERWGAPATREEGDTGGRLRWLVIAACGPLHDGNGVSAAAKRWKKAFCGLRALMGYGAATMENAYEGQYFMDLVKNGTPICEAWLQTGTAIQGGTNGFPAPDGPDIFVSALCASDDALSDVLDDDASYSALPAATTLSFTKVTNTG